MLTSSSLYRDALPYSNRRVTRVEVFHGTTRVADFLDDPQTPEADRFVVSGTVNASLTSRVSRTLQMDVNPKYYPALPTDLLSPYVAVLKVSTGIGYPDGSYEVFPVFTGRVYDVQRQPSGGVTVSGEDLAADVIEFRFEQPQASVTTNTITEETQRLILQVLPDAVFGVNDVVDTLTPVLVWDEDRGRALDDLATALQARWYALGDGTFVVRKYPYTAGTPVLSLVDESGGVVMTATTTRSRVGAANSVTVVSERMDGTAPVRYTARDMVPTSPTFFGGPYGKVSQILKVQTPLNQAQAQQLAEARLSVSTALVEQWRIDCVPDYTLEPGDTIDVTYRGLSAVQVIDQMSYPLVTGPAMSLSCRSSVAAPAFT